MFLRSRNSIKLLLILYYASGSQKFKMAVHKPEILISQPVYNITAPFQRLYPCFRGPGIHSSYVLILCDASGQSKIQDGGSQTGSTYISACIKHSCTIPKAIPMFSRSGNSIKLLLILYYASGSKKSKMAAYKPGTFISQLVYNVDVQFQPLYQCFIR